MEDWEKQFPDEVSRERFRAMLKAEHEWEMACLKEPLYGLYTVLDLKETSEGREVELLKDNNMKSVRFTTDKNFDVRIGDKIQIDSDGGSPLGSHLKMDVDVSY